MKAILQSKSNLTGLNQYLFVKKNSKNKGNATALL